MAPSYTIMVDIRTSKKEKIRVPSLPGPATRSSHELISEVGEEMQHRIGAHAQNGGVKMHSTRHPEETNFMRDRPLMIKTHHTSCRTRNGLNCRANYRPLPAD